MSSSVALHPEVADALAAGEAVVALESAAITHGLPREPVDGGVPACLTRRDDDAVLARRAWWPDAHAWSADAPANLELARAMEAVVRGAGAVPATVAMIEGVLRIGLAPSEVERLAAESDPIKCSTRELAAAIATRRTGGTTVAATLAACVLAGRVGPAPIRTFATGGLGGVHRGWTTRPDVSADLRALATHPVCVTCSGAKSILDLRATLEALETLGVPVIGVGTETLPRFTASPDDALALPMRADEPDAIAAQCRTHWDDLARPEAIVAARPVDPAFAIDADATEETIRALELELAREGVSGGAVTPALLARLAERTGGRSLDANLAVLLGSAGLAARIAHALAAGSA